MRIEEDLKLGFKDVLIRPKRSTLKSRSEVELERQFTFKHSGCSWSGVPIIAANMDTVGTFRMAEAWLLSTFSPRYTNITASSNGLTSCSACRNRCCAT